MAASSGSSLDVLGLQPQQISNQQEFLHLPAGKVLAFVKPLYPGQPDRLSHVALTLGRGDIVGSNNNIVAGTGGWRRTSLGNVMFNGATAMIAGALGQVNGFKLYLILFRPITQANCVIM
jgi:hypothetical protein